MATGKRKSSSGRKTSGRKTNSGRKKNDIQQESFTEEVILWVILAISILLFISNFGIGGAIGNAVSSFFFGVFGLIAYIFPVVLVIGTFFAASNKGNRIATVKIVAAVFFVLFLCFYISCNVGLAVFNLIPIPPLDGSKVLFVFLPDKAVEFFYRYQMYFFIGLFVLLYVGILNTPINWLSNQILDFISWLASLPYMPFVG